MNSEKNGSLLIIGCGWVGKKLGQQLAKKGTIVYGTTRSSSNFSELSELDIKPVKLELPAPSLSKIRLPETDSVLISISPGRGDDRSEYPKLMGQLAQVLAQRNTQVIMYSSTSVYGNAKGEVKETDATSDPDSDNAIVAAEGELRKYVSDAVILRLAGLYGADRHPAKYMAGRKDISNGDAPVNLVHREDVIKATEMVIEKDIHNEIFNISAPIHPAKKEIYTTITERLEMKKPKFLNGGGDGKVVSSDKVVELGFEFLHEEPLDFKKLS
ncbi:NAD-dependent epimerase/dehydratase family protein [Gracilimonas sp.]|uniref:NAD-dependent epimerase/dehydratase family protein n=1 Tax=Gracilimonas sp. TaxID=1974203 RepID=UPI0028722F7E|nr:NAD-dependent epimerase/dehydratase family protein [Gracilimonas sp.]